jgi:hypothetical protein
MASTEHRYQGAKEFIAALPSRRAGDPLTILSQTVPGKQANRSQPLPSDNRQVYWSIASAGDGFQHRQVQCVDVGPLRSPILASNVAGAKASGLSESTTGAKQACGGKFFCG